MQSNNLKSTVMAQENYNNGLATAGLEGKSIVRCDNQKCETCVNQNDDCAKLICSGGHVCVCG